MAPNNQRRDNESRDSRDSNVRGQTWDYSELLNRIDPGTVEETMRDFKNLDKKTIDRYQTQWMHLMPESAVATVMAEKLGGDGMDARVGQHIALLTLGFMLGQRACALSEHRKTA